MYFITNKLKRKYNANLLFTDKDILVCQIKTEDVYEDFIRIKICLILAWNYNMNKNNM